MTIFGYLLIGAILLSAAGIVLAYRYKSRKMLKRLDQMLDTAINGEFTEDSFDESMLSAVESKLAHYLAASTVSARNLREEKNKIESLISDISHQTKTPITNIMLYTELLSEQELSPKNQSCVKALEKQTEKLRILIDALVKTSRLETGIITLHPSFGSLQPVLRAAADQLKHKAEAKNIDLTVKEDDAKALFDPKWTEEAVFNLLDNAVKYTPKGGQVTLYTTEYPLFTAVNVRDSGKGIPESEQPGIFRRFYRGTDHQKEEGIGIGLYLVRQIAENQGGYVKVFSRKGQGATFSIYIPRD